LILFCNWDLERVSASMGPHEENRKFPCSWASATRDEPVPMADIRDSFPSVLRVIESMAEENERNKNRDLESPDLIQPRLVEGLSTHFEQILPKEETIETRGPSLIQKGIQFMRQLSQPADDHLSMEMCESLLKADFDEGTEQVPVVRDPTPPPFNFPTRRVKTPEPLSHDHQTPQNESDFGPGEEDDNLLRDVSNNMEEDPLAKDEPKKKANRRKRKKGNKTNAATTKS